MSPQSEEYHRWHSGQNQSSVAASSGEAEYYALIGGSAESVGRAAAIKVGRWKFLVGVGFRCTPAAPRNM